MKTKVWKPEMSNINTKKIGQGCRIHSHVWIGKNVKIGKRCKIQAFAFIPDGVTIEDGVFIGPGAVFVNDNYPPSEGKGWKPTIVRKGAVIGANTTILAGLEIGERAIIGAGSVVTKSVGVGEIWYGIPAVFTKKI